MARGRSPAIPSGGVQRSTGCRPDRPNPVQASPGELRGRHSPMVVSAKPAKQEIPQIWPDLEPRLSVLAHPIGASRRLPICDRQGRSWVARDATHCSANSSNGLIWYPPSAHVRCVRSGGSEGIRANPRRAAPASDEVGPCGRARVLCPDQRAAGSRSRRCSRAARPRCLRNPT